ncbi:ThiF family adenylyltransferase [uncultured Deefgea sp.]|uniref:ThiF family adenylyltransferase n=1 Tax=uncultured Deefgea sp. TaxID=1304914 RepID=UPI00259A3F8D|nr:ThiF family adenylyltransferase [uncultured Deefgea sp.]
MTPTQQAFIADIEHALVDIGAQEIRFEVVKTKPTWAFSIEDGIHCWLLELRPCGWGFQILPYIKWKSAEQYWGWPHTSISGDICVSDREGLEYDPNDIFGVLKWLVEKATKQLRENHAMDESARLTLFADEVEGYAKNAGATSIELSEALNTQKTLYAEVYRKDKGLKAPSVVKRVNSGITKFDYCQQERIGLLDVKLHQLPNLDMELNTNWWTNFLGRLDEQQQAIATSKAYKGLMLRIPNAYGHALILIYWGKTSQSKSWKAVVHVPERRDHDYLVRRTGAAPLSQHVVIVGLGSIGSRVAEHLVLAGIRKLTLIDYDLFSADNLGRHILGQGSINLTKVDALATQLRDRMPGVEINPIAKDVLTAFASTPPRDARAIVLATGNVALERSIIREAFRENWPQQIISTCVEAAGLGGHAIAMRSGIAGCLDCLYIDSETQAPTAEMRTSLIAPGQTISRQLTGCGAFTPYSSIDATRTALLATELVLSGHIVYTRWAGDGELAHRAGIATSPTYRALRDLRIPSTLKPEEFAQAGCPCCGE